jgi:hypothetical protein
LEPRGKQASRGLPVLEFKEPRVYKGRRGLRVTLETQASREQQASRGQLVSKDLQVFRGLQAFRETRV